MPIRTIACADCGHPYETSRPNTKVDHVCRILRDLPYATKMSKCQLCGTSFHPIHRKDLLCGEHAPPAKLDELVNCAYCGEVRRSVARDIQVCTVCARNTNFRERFWRNLTQRQTKQRNGTFERAPRIDEETV